MINLDALESAARAATPVAWLFQHDETGRTGFIEDYMADDFFAMNPRLHRIRPVYDHAAADPATVLALCRIARAARERWYEMYPSGARIGTWDALEATLRDAGLL